VIACLRPALYIGNFEPYVLSPVVGTWENPNPKNLQPSGGG
jgi:hypothetical protein